MKNTTELYNDIIYTLSGTFPNPGVDKKLSGDDLKLFELTFDIISQPNGFQNAYICYKIGLKQKILLKFFKECCNNDIRTFNLTFILFKELLFTADDINNNLRLTEFIPFVNKDIQVNGSSFYNFSFYKKDQLWSEYKNKLLEDYRKRLNDHINYLNKKK